MIIRAFEEDDTESVVSIWEACGLTRSWNDPRKDIARKLQVQPELFLVGEEAADQGGSGIIATVMAGYDGHRGWLYYVAVLPARRGTGVGRRMVAHAEGLLIDLGCPKVNVQVRGGNAPAAEAWAALGYSPDGATGLGKRLIPDE